MCLAVTTAAGCAGLTSGKTERAPRKRLLAIGDSITSAGIWQRRVGELLDMDVRSHCKGGIGALEMVDGDGVAPPQYDPDDFGVTKLYDLSIKDVRDVDLIFIMGFYNELGSIVRRETRGVGTDAYPEQKTFCGRVNYVIRRVRETLAKAGNDTARIVLVSPHCYGRNMWVDMTAEETGDLWIDAPLASSCADARITVSGRPGHYWSHGGKWEPHVAPYPWYADQLHLNECGYRRLGETIVSVLKRDGLVGLVK